MTRLMGGKRATEMVNEAYANLQMVIAEVADGMSPTDALALTETWRTFDGLMKEGKPLPTEWCAFPIDIEEKE